MLHHLLQTFPLYPAYALVLMYTFHLLLHVSSIPYLCTLYYVPWLPNVLSFFVYYIYHWVIFHLSYISPNYSVYSLHNVPSMHGTYHILYSNHNLYLLYPHRIAY